jgi:hypothetical protein
MVQFNNGSPWNTQSTIFIITEERVETTRIAQNKIFELLDSEKHVRID